MESLMCWDGVKFLEQMESFVPLGITDLGRTSLMDRSEFQAAWEEGMARDGSSTRYLYTDELDGGKQGGESFLRLGASRARLISLMLQARVGRDGPSTWKAGTPRWAFGRETGREQS